MNEESNDKPYNKPGPQTGHWAEITKMGIVVGRNKIAVPPDEVEHQARLGCTDREIAAYFGVKEDTLRRHFADYLLKGRHNLKTTLRQAQLRAAIENLNPALLIWLGKNILQQNDSGTTSDDNRPLPWTDDMDDTTEDENDNHTEVVDGDENADTEA